SVHPAVRADVPRSGSVAIAQARCPAGAGAAWKTKGRLPHGPPRCRKTAAPAQHKLKTNAEPTAPTGGEKWRLTLRRVLVQLGVPVLIEAVDEVLDPGRQPVAFVGGVVAVAADGPLAVADPHDDVPDHGVTARQLPAQVDGQRARRGRGTAAL